MNFMRRWLLGLALVVSGGMAWEAQAGRLPESLTVSDKQLLVGGQPFVVRGVNYQPVPTTGPGNWPDDWTMDPSVVISDLSKMKEMGVNTIRVYVKYERLFANWNEQNDPVTDLQRLDQEGRTATTTERITSPGPTTSSPTNASRGWRTEPIRSEPGSGPRADRPAPRCMPRSSMGPLPSSVCLSRRRMSGPRSPSPTSRSPQAS